MILRISHHMQFQQKKSNQAVLFVAILLASHFYLRVLHGVQQHNTANSEYIKIYSTSDIKCSTTTTTPTTKQDKQQSEE